MSDADAPVKDVRILHEAGIGRRMECVECGHLLPLDQWTECDRCGAHLSLKVAVEAPAQDGFS